MRHRFLRKDQPFIDAGRGEGLGNSWEVPFSHTVKFTRMNNRALAQEILETDEIARIP
jgi:hypothetical protein